MTLIWLIFAAPILEDVLAGRTEEVTGDQELADYLDTVLGQA
jgi:hypothetical protein